MTFIEWLADKGIDVYLLTLKQTQVYYQEYIKVYGLDI